MSASQPRALYQVAIEHQEALAALLDMDIDEQEREDTLSALVEEGREAASTLISAICQLETNAAAEKARLAVMQEHLDTLKADAKRLEAKADQYRDRLARCMHQLGIKKAGGDTVPVFIATTRTEIELMSDGVPDEFVRIEVVKKLDRKAANKEARRLADEGKSLNWASVKTNVPAVRRKDKQS